MPGASPGAVNVATPARSLSLLDAAFFLLESDERLANVGPLLILRPRAGGRGALAFADRLLREMKKRPVAPPFDRVYQPPGWLGLPRLVSAAGVDAADHCHRHTLPAPGTEAQLFDTVCRLHEQRLDRSRPLWELHVIDGLARGRVAVYMKIHHGLMDGRGMQAAFDRFFSTSPDDRRVHAPWEPRPDPARRKHGLPVPAASATPVPAPPGPPGPPKGSLLAALGRQALASARMAPGMPLPFIDTPTAFDTTPSVRRCLAYAVLPMPRVRALAQRHDAKVNDIVLTVLDMAMNTYLGRREGAPLVVDMPLALAAASGGNALAILQFPLGAPDSLPLVRLAQIKRHTARVKLHVRQTEPDALVNYTALVHAVPAALELLKVSRAPVLANAVISNPGGYAEKRYVAGAELEIGLPVSVLAPGQALNITVATYDRNLQVAFLGLESSLPDIQRLADLTVDAFDELMAAGAPRRTARAPRVEKTQSADAPARRSRQGPRV